MDATQPFPYDISFREFEYNGDQYKVALTPELYPEAGILDFTGNYLGILINSKMGTKTFELMAGSEKKWQPKPKWMDPGLIDELDKIISEIRKS